MSYNTWLNLYRLVGILLAFGILCLGAAISINSNTFIVLCCLLLAATVFLFMFVATTATSEENKKGNYLFSVQPPVKVKRQTKAYLPTKQLTNIKRIPKQIMA